MSFPPTVLSHSPYSGCIFINLVHDEELRNWSEKNHTTLLPYEKLENCYQNIIKPPGMRRVSDEDLTIEVQEHLADVFAKDSTQAILND